MKIYISDQLKRRSNSVQLNPMKHCAEYGDFKTLLIHREREY
ncbi:hypothetical protein [Clostridium sp. E02]|nr:hypothetical protein [Clostridium sp. E02]